MDKPATNPSKARQVCIPLLMMALCSLQGCMYYYKVQNVSPVEQKEVKTFASGNKYIILHQRDSAWHLSEPLVSENTLYARLSELPANRYKFETTRPRGGNRYVRDKESYVLEEVHLYVTDSLTAVKPYPGSVQIPLPAIRYAEVYVKAKGRTTASWLVPGIGGTVVAGGLLVGIITVSALSNFKINVSH